MNKRFFGVLFIIFSFLIVSNCAIQEFITAYNDPSSGNMPKFAYDFTAPIFDKTFTIADYYKTSAGVGGAYNQAIPQLGYPTAGTLVFPDILGAFNLVAPNVDFTGDSVADMTVTKYKSTDASLTISVQYKIAGVAQPLSAGQFDTTDQVGSVIQFVNQAAGNKTYNFHFGTPVLSADTLTVTMTSIDFFSPTDDYTLDGGIYDVKNSSLKLVNAAPLYGAGDLDVTLTLSLGSTVEVIGNVGSTAQLLTTEVPLSSIPLLSNFNFIVSVENGMCDKLLMNFNSTDLNVAVSNNALAGSGFYYTTTSATTTGKFALTSTGSNPSITFSLLKSDLDEAAPGTAKDILLSKTGYIRLKLSINANTGY